MTQFARARYVGLHHPNTEDSEMLKLIVSCLIACGLLLGCTAESTPSGAPSGGHSHEHVHSAKCGCTIEGVEECGNYVEVGGSYVPLVGVDSISEQEFCKKTGLLVELEGEMKDGKFHAKKFGYHDHD